MASTIVTDKESKTVRSSTEHRSLPKAVYTITIDVVNALMAERDMLKAQIERRDQEIHQLRYASHAMTAGADRQAESSEADLTPRREITYQHAVSALVHLILGWSPSGVPNSNFRTQEAIVSALVAHYGDRLGIGERTLHGMFAAANKRLGPP